MARKPEKLRHGDTIGIVGPASPAAEDRLQRGLAYLVGQGFKLKLGHSVRRTHGYLAGSDEERASDFNRMLADPEVKAIFCIRGGYGTPRLLQRIDYGLAERHPKIVLGYSDLTALQLALFARAQLVSFSGPMVAVEMAEGLEPFTARALWDAVMQGESVLALGPANARLRCLKPGAAQGPLLGGCLSMLCALMGTPYLPDLTGAILFIEDIGEEPYRIDRQLTQLKHAGVLHKLAGLAIGRFEDCAPKGPAPSLTLEEVFEEVLSDVDIPVVSGLPYGHLPKKRTIPVGVQARLDAHGGRLATTEPAVVESL